MWGTIVTLLFAALASAAYSLWCIYVRTNRKPRGPCFPESSLEQDKTWDYVVVGAGAAGCAAVHHLAHNSDASILLVESGSCASDLGASTKWAASWVENFWSRETDHGLFTEKQAGLKGRQMPYARGRGRGGSMLINAQMWVLGNPLDWDQQGSPEWTWDKVHGHFKALEDFPESKTGFRGRGGPIPVRTVGTASPELGAFMDYSGLPRVEDYNETQQNGIGLCQQNNSDINARHNPYDYLVAPLVRKGRVSLVDCAPVDKVLFEGTRATGIQLRSGTKLLARDVILTAGAIHTPQILMLSGVGPAAHLQEMGLPVVADLPVGEALQEHVTLPVTALLKKPLVEDGSGLNVAGFFKSKWAQEHEPERGPDLQIACGGGEMAYCSLALKIGFETFGAGGPLMRFACAAFLAFAQWSRLLDGRLKRFFYGAVVVNHTASRGTLKLKDANPRSAPLIDINIATDPADIVRLQEGTMRVRNVFTDSPFSEWVDTLLDKDVASAKTDGEWAKCIQDHAIHAWHPACTTPMGEVVDAATLRVKGLTGLRVADISILTRLPSGNTMVPALLTGARGAELILKSASI